MQSRITSKFQTTIPKEIREKLKLDVYDAIEWSIEDDKIIVEPVKKPVLKYKGYVRVGKGCIESDIALARKRRALRFK